MSTCITSTAPSFGYIALFPALISAVTTFALFVLKDWLFAAQQRKVFAKRLLRYSCGTLATALSTQPGSVELKTSILESYTDVFVGDPTLEAHLTEYMKYYLWWRSGYFESAAEAQRHKASEALQKIAGCLS